MQRRQLLIGAALAASAGLGAIFWQAGEQPASYPHIRLNSTTLGDTPDNAAAIKAIISSERFKGFPVMVEFVAGWCPHCARLEPEMDRALAERAAAGQRLGRLTITVQEGNYRTGERGAFGYITAFQQMAPQPYFPQVQLWQDGQLKASFIGERSAADINRFADEALNPPQSGHVPAPQPD